MMADLFSEPLIAGLDYRETLIGEDEAAELVDRLSAMDLAPFRFQGWLGKRKVHSVGWRYDFDDASFMPADPLPGWLQPSREKAAAVAQVAPDDVVHVVVARSDSGAGIGCFERPLVVKMDVGDDRHAGGADDLLQRRGAVDVRARHPNDIGAGLLAATDLIDRRLRIGGRRVGHGLDGDRRVPADRH